jgi:hypothetical protein
LLRNFGASAVDAYGRVVDITHREEPRQKIRVNERLSQLVSIAVHTRHVRTGSLYIRRNNG